MNKIMTKLSGLFLGLAMMVGVGVGISATRVIEAKAGNSFIMTFDANSKTDGSGTSLTAQDGGTSLTTSNFATKGTYSFKVSTVWYWINTGSENIDSVSKCENIYPGSNSRLKCNKAKGDGKLSFTIKGNENISKVELYAYVASGTSKISLENSEEETIEISNVETKYTFNKTTSDKLLSFTFGTGATSNQKAVYLTKMEIFTGSDKQSLSIPTNFNYDSENEKLTWAKSTNATGYSINIDNGSTDVILGDVNEYDVSELAYTTHTAKIKALAGTSDLYKDSEYSDVINWDTTATLESIEWVEGTNMENVDYVAGQSWDPSGLQILLTYNRGTQTITLPYEGVELVCDPEVATLNKNVDILASFGGMDTSVEPFEVNVVPLAVSKLERSGQTNYFTTADKFSSSSVITATWNDGTEETIYYDTPAEETKAGSKLEYGLYNGKDDVYLDKVSIISLGEDMLTDYNNLWVGIFYGGVLASKYQIQVEGIIDYSKGAFYRVDTEPTDYSGTYIIVSEVVSKAWNGEDAENGCVSVDIKNNTIIEYDANFGIVSVQPMKDGYSIRVKAGSDADNIGKYIGGTSNSNKLNFNLTETLNTFNSFNEGELKITSNTSIFMFNNSASSANRFRYYKSSTSGDLYSLCVLYKWVANEDKSIEYSDSFIGKNLCNNGITKPSTIDWKALENEYSKLSSGVQSLYKSATYEVSGSGESTVVTATGTTSQKAAEVVAKYDLIVGRYGSSTYNDFMQRNPSPTMMTRGPLFSSTLFDGSDSSMWIIGVVAVVGLSSICGYFFYRKRKEI